MMITCILVEGHDLLKDNNVFKIFEKTNFWKAMIIS